MAVGTFIGNASEWGKAGHRSTPDDYRIEYEGAVLQTFERNGYDDSDFYAIVYDEATDSIKHVCYATTRGWTYANYATVDATPEVLAKAQRAAYEADVRVAQMQDEWNSTTIAKGKQVAVVGTGKNEDRPRRWKGEIIEAGTEGTVFWIGVDSFRSSRWHTSYRLGVELADGRKVFGPDDAFVVVNPEQYLRTEGEIRERLGSPERITNFHRSVPGYLNMVA